MLIKKDKTHTIAFTDLSLVQATEQLFMCFNKDLA